MSRNIDSEGSARLIVYSESTVKDNLKLRADEKIGPMRSFIGIYLGN